jgi:hypothetical protein
VRLGISFVLRSHRHLFCRFVVVIHIYP